MNEDKMTLTRRRAELIERLTTPLPAEERARVQGDLSIVNAKIKALNTIEAAQFKAAADRRRAAGLAEAQSNAARSLANTGLANESAVDTDPDQTAAIDTWIFAVLLRGGVKARRTRGALDLVDAPAKWVAIVEALCAGIHAAARGDVLPEVAAAEPKAKKRS